MKKRHRLNKFNLAFYKNKGGQITMFILLGIVVLIIFVFLFYLISSGISQRLETQRQQTIITALEASSIDYLTGECAVDALKSGLILIGQQGGWIYEEQGGFDTPFLTNFNGSNISYDVSYNEQDPKGVNLAPVYPCPLLFLTDEPRFCEFPYYSGRVNFGNRWLPDLEGGGVLTIKRQLENYIQDYVQDCTDFESLVQEEGLAGYDITWDEPQVQVIFGLDNIRVILDYPINVMIGDEEPIHHLLGFKAKEEINFRGIYNLVREVLDKDNNLADFDISQNISQENLWRAGEMIFEEHRFDNGDVFILEDSTTQIYGNDYIFQWARQNRPPVLYYIANNASELDPYDFLVIEGEKIEMIAEGADPDEDLINFSFDGGSLGSFDGNIFEKNSTNLSQWPAYNVTVEVHDWVWTDEQRVRLFVDRVLEPAFTIYSYPEIGDGFISVEDPVYLNASPTLKSLAPNTPHSYYWEYWGPEVGTGLLEYFEIGADSECMVVPGFENCSVGDFDILNIRGQHFNESGDTTMFLTVTAHYSDRVQEVKIQRDVTVKECLPLRSSSPPYPYNITDPFLSDHSCCLGNVDQPHTWQLANSSTVCYSQSENCTANHPKTTKATNRHCDGLRGNTCTGDLDVVSTCGYNDWTNCFNINDNCEGLGAYQYSDEDEGWCYGAEGCGSFCTQEVVAPVGMNGTIALSQLNSSFECGCDVGNMDQYCDDDYDGDFEKQCQRHGGPFTYYYSCDEVSQS
ncbi:hypothetical protein ACFLZB_01635 [Nanoarchaeota archaeon]